MREYNDMKALIASIRTTPLWTAALACSLLAACSGSGGSNSRSEGVATSYSGKVRQNIEVALCAGQAGDAVKQLESEPLASPSDRFYLALALEQSGHPSRAQLLYMQLMQAGFDGHVRIACGRTILADGSIAGESARRLADLARTLAVMDVNLRPSPPLHQGLPPSDPASPNAGPAGIATTVEKPSSQSPFGQWFAHLSSYSSLESAVQNKSKLEAKFASLSGIIDQWETDANGKRVIRLGIRVKDKPDAAALCQAVKSQGEYCAVIDTSK